MADNLSPPGSSQYNSNTLSVGDGTWDSSRNSFLLPNLMGLNFATMRYNGMGNRFKDLPGYHRLILGHGILAAITFLAIVPAAIFLAKYGARWPGPRASFKLHVYFQILTVFLATVILVLGWFAVGPERSLTNPHHGIGVAIYVLILWQFIYGSCMYRRERKRTKAPNKLPLAVWLHKLQGRTIGILAVVQIALGLTLYGSPRVLFILYALWCFFLLFAYLVLEYRNKPRVGGGPMGHQEFQSDYGSYLSGSRADAPPPRREREESHWGRNILAGAGALGAYEWWKRRRDRRRDERDEGYEESIVSRQRPSSRPPPPRDYPPPRGAPPPVGPPPMDQPPPVQFPVGPPPMNAGHRRGTQSALSRESWEDEKYSEPPRNTWRNRILGATGAFAAFEGARSLFGRRRRRDDDYSDDGRYTPPMRATENVVDRADVSRVEAGQAPASPDTPRVNMGGVQPMTPSMTPSRPPRQPGAVESQMSYESREYDMPLRESMAEYGPIAGFREWNRARRARREAERADMIRRQQLDSEMAYNQRNSGHYPGPQDASQRQQTSVSGTVLTGPDANLDPSRSNLRPDTSHPPLPAEAGTIPASSQYAGSRQNVQTEQGYTIPPPPPGPPPNAVRPDGYSPPQFGSARMPEGAVNPDPSRLVSENTAMNESTAYGRDPPLNAAETVAAGAASRDTMSPSRPSGSRSRLQKRNSVNSGSVSNVAGPSGAVDNAASPPVSVKVKYANDGRSVTVQRLNEEEAAAERAARRQERRSRRRRGSSLSSGLEDDGPTGPRYRRKGPVRQSSDQPITNVPPPPVISSSAGRRESELNLPPGPPPVPQHSSPASGQGYISSPPGPPPVNESGFGSPGDAGTGTDVSAFDSNRRRRRAERARQAAARGGSGNRVEFG
jgi:hypothetical protein